ncbi:hypothetical protein RFI_38936, partial [Reticulomyxa filosa]
LEKLKSEIRKHNLDKFDYRSKLEDYDQLQQISSELRERHAQLTLKYFSLECDHERMIHSYNKLSEHLSVKPVTPYQGMHANGNSSNSNSSSSNININIHEDMQGQLLSPSSNPSVVSPEYNVSINLSSSHTNDHHNNNGNNNNNNNNMSENNENDDEAKDSVIVIPSLGMKGILSSSSPDQMNNLFSSTKTSMRPPQHHNYTFLHNIANASREEILEEVARLKEVIRDMTESKFQLLKSNQIEIARLRRLLAKFQANHSAKPHNITQTKTKLTPPLKYGKCCCFIATQATREEWLADENDNDLLAESVSPQPRRKRAKSLIAKNQTNLWSSLGST